jgi:hypothetical protein
MELISRRNSNFGDLEENSWTRWVRIAAKAIHDEASGSDPIVRCYGTLMRVSWDEVSYERHYEDHARTALEAVLRLAEFASTGVLTSCSGVTWRPTQVLKPFG